MARRDELLAEVERTLGLHEGSGLLIDVEGRCAEAFDELVGACGAPEALTLLASHLWHRDAALVASVSGARTLARRPRDHARVAIYYRRLGTGGAERVTLDTARLWRRQGYEVVLLCDEGNEDGEDLASEGIEVATLPDCLSPDPEVQRRRPAALHEALVSHGVDALVYCQWLSPTLGWDLLATHAAGASFVVFTHGTTRVLTGYGNPPDLRFASMYRHADGVVCLSEEDRRFWLTFNGSVHRVVNKVDPAFLTSAPARLDGQRMAWVGRVSSDKSPLEMLDVLSAVRREVPEARLVLMGPFGDCDRERYLARAEELGVADAIELAGDVAHDELPSRLAEVDLVVFTSHMEGYPVALAEAKALGIPCALYDLSHLTLLEGGRGVRLAPIGDVRALAREAALLLTDKRLARELGADARAHVRELQDFDLAAVWEEVLGSSAGAATGRLERGAGVACALAELGEAQLRQRQERDALAAQVEELRRSLEEREAVLADVSGSVSFKAGRALTAPLRAARDILGRNSGR